MEYKKNILVDQYIAAAPVERQELMQAIRNLIFETAPEVEEMISQGMPAYQFKGKYLAYFANGRNHIGFLVHSKMVADYREQLKGYVTFNSGFQLKLDEPLPLDLMRDFIMSRMHMILQGAKKK